MYELVLVFASACQLMPGSGVTPTTIIQYSTPFYAWRDPMDVHEVCSETKAVVVGTYPTYSACMTKVAQGAESRDGLICRKARQ